MSEQPLAIRMLHDRVLVDPDAGSSERRSGGGSCGLAAMIVSGGAGGKGRARGPSVSNRSNSSPCRKWLCACNCKA